MEGSCSFLLATQEGSTTKLGAEDDKLLMVFKLTSIANSHLPLERKRERERERERGGGRRG